MSERDPRVSDDTGLAPPARFTRETLLGCLGIACVLLMLPLLWVALGSTPLWVARMAPLVVLTLAAVGVALMTRVPGGFARRSRDPHRPLTRAGAPPIVERPATSASRASYLLAAGLSLLAGAGYLVESVAQRAHTPWGLFVSLTAGFGLLAQAALVYGDRLAAPALRWQRRSIAHGAFEHGSALAGIGLVAISSSLMLAMLEGFLWGAMGLAALFVMLVMSAPLFRSAPGRDRPAGSRRVEPEDGD